MVIFFILACDYVVLRSRQVIAMEEVENVEEPVVIEPQRQRDKV